MKEQLIRDNELNKEEGRLTIGDLEILVRENKEVKYIIDEDGKEIEFSEKERRKIIDDLEDMVEKQLKQLVKNATYIRTYPKNN